MVFGYKIETRNNSILRQRKLTKYQLGAFHRWCSTEQHILIRLKDDLNRNSHYNKSGVPDQNTELRN
jgi:hypothetical protein